jgi:uncharacterized protein (DUF302 family)
MNTGIWKNVRSDFDAALARLPEALAAEGFGVLTRIDMRETLKPKLGVEFRRYQILGACNPTLAHAAVSEDPRVGVMLPCNVVIFERDDGGVTVGAVDPMQSIGDGAGPALQALAEGVREKLARAVAAID